MINQQAKKTYLIHLRYRRIFFVFNSNEAINRDIEEKQNSLKYSVDEMFDEVSKRTKVLFASTDENRFNNYIKKIQTNTEQWQPKK